HSSCAAGAPLKSLPPHPRITPRNLSAPPKLRQLRKLPPIPIPTVNNPLSDGHPRHFCMEPAGPFSSPVQRELCAIARFSAMKSLFDLSVRHPTLNAPLPQTHI
ncbi:MAG: hypothetical protein WA715_19790, partial [Candidatus Acidiferrum sp.]